MSEYRVASQMLCFDIELSLSGTCRDGCHAVWSEGRGGGWGRRTVCVRVDKPDQLSCWARQASIGVFGRFHCCTWSGPGSLWSRRPTNSTPVSAWHCVCVCVWDHLHYFHRGCLKVSDNLAHLTMKECHCITRVYPIMCISWGFNFTEPHVKRVNYLF